jgi:hypothetical protein
MKRNIFLILSALLICFCNCLCAQTWSNILSQDRAIDWSVSGVASGIPSTGWTQCGSTINADSTAATINSAIQNCSANHFVLLGAGTFSLNAGIVMKSGVALRGMGADQTILNFSGNNSCNGLGAAICIAGGDGSDYFGNAKTQPGGSNAATWTSGYTKGTNQIVLSNIGSNGISVGKYIYLDQANDTSTNSGFFVCESTSASPACSAEGGNGDPGRVVSSVSRQQVQIVKVTACSPSCSNGATFTISPALYAPNYSSNKTPGAWWPSATIQNVGLENLSVDATNAGGMANVVLFNAMNIWVKGTRQIRSCTCNRSIIWMWQAAHATIQDNYFYGTSGHSQNYGVESYIASDCLVMNNIFHHVVGPMVLHANTGSVYAYNYAINDSYDDGNLPLYHYMIGASQGHSGGVMYNLMEGNIGPGLKADAIHGNQVANTVFRNYWLGYDSNRLDATNSVNFEAWSRYWNIVGNVLGKPGYHNAYAGTGSKAIYALGLSRSTVPSDPLVETTMMRWGNYDTVNGGVRWTASENGSSAATFPALTSPSQTLPSSFFMSVRPNWWPSAKAWPPIGPDVTGGNISNLGGHVYTIPAQDCYSNVMKGPADGSGSVLNFNADKCYYSLNAPVNLRFIN